MLDFGLAKAVAPADGESAVTLGRSLTSEGTLVGTLLYMDFPAAARLVPEHRLYAWIARTEPDAAPGRYNAVVRRLVSFERAWPCAR